MTVKIRWRLSVAIVVVCGAAVGVGAYQTTGGRPMAIDDLIGAVRVADPRLSPDGRTVVYTRTTTDLKTGARNADIWAVPADGSAPPKALITGAKSENTPRFIGDGKRIAFISSRDGAPQIYLADAQGQNVVKVTDVAMGVQPPLIVSPDGTRLAFVSDVYPECTTDACNKAKMDEAEKNPVKARRLTRLLYRHWDEWRENVRHHVFVANVTGGPARDLTPGDFDSPPGQQEDGAIAFSPDGTQIAFVSSREGADAEAWTTNHEVFVVPVSGGEARKVTANPGSDSDAGILS